MGQNPTSGLLSLQRRREIYAVCQEFDVLIIEDDPYWYLQYPTANSRCQAARGKPVSENFPTDHNYNAMGKGSGFPFLDSLVPSYLHVDTDGRVIRLDTFSKTVAPGCRLGWVTAQPAIVEKILRITETSTQQPSGFVQSMIAELIMGPQSTDDGGKGGSKDGSGWKVDGWVRWLEGLRGNYERRMQKMSSILEEGKYAVRSSGRQRANEMSSFSSDEEEEFQIVSKTQMFDFVYPMAGMFLWMHVHFESHPLYSKYDHEKLARALWIYMTQEPFRCLVAPGPIFSPTDDIRRDKGWQYFRLCFAAVNEDVVAKHSKSVVSAFQSFWTKKRSSEIDDILGGEGVSGTGVMTLASTQVCPLSSIITVVLFAVSAINIYPGRFCVFSTDVLESQGLCLVS